jgi:hypothetical protein
LGRPSFGEPALRAHPVELPRAEGISAGFS